MGERGLWAIKVVFSCLVPGSGMIREEECCLLEYTKQTEEVGVGMDSGLLGLHIKGMLRELANSGRGSLSPVSEAPDDKLHIYIVNITRHLFHPLQPY